MNLFSMGNNRPQPPAYTPPHTSSSAGSLTGTSDQQNTMSSASKTSQGQVSSDQLWSYVICVTAQVFYKRSTKNYGLAWHSYKYRFIQYTYLLLIIFYKHSHSERKFIVMQWSHRGVWENSLVKYLMIIWSCVLPVIDGTGKQVINFTNQHDGSSWLYLAPLSCLIAITIKVSTLAILSRLWLILLFYNSFFLVHVIMV